MTVPEEMAAEVANKKAEREALRGVIQQWNANRLDLFELSEPNEDLEFHGVMRFYFQDSGQKVATKCIRVASDATSQAVIETLIEKFRPDMRMLSVPEYALYEIHENGEERKLGLEEKPLLVQLNWHIDDREGRFLLKRIDDKTNAQGVGFHSSEGSSFKRKLSKREKKQMKKQEKLSRLKSLEQDENAAPDDQNGVAEKLYTELPETSFTRSISNPEAVMRRRRQQKLERKLQQFRSKDGGPDTGGTLKIYGEALCKDVPYKTLLLSVRDSAAQVVREMLAKYGLDKVDPQQYCLVQVNTEGGNGNAHQEYILDDDECPLAILMNHPSTRGSIMFHVRRRPADYVPRKRKKKPAGKWNELDYRYEDERLPFLLELNPDGTDIPNGAGARHRLQPNVTEVGSEIPIGPQAVQAQTLTLTGPTVMPRHCVIAFTENIVTLTPCSRDAHTYVNNQRIHQTTILQNGAIVKFGRMHTFRFIDPAPEDRIRQRHDSNRQLDYAYDRRSPDATSQDVNSEKYRSDSGTPNGGQVQAQGQSSNPPSPSKSCATASGPRSPTHSGQTAEGPTHNYETTFDLDGNVETASLTSSRDGNRLSQYDRQPRGTDPILPAVLEFLEETEEAFLHAVITDVEPSAPQFKLAPTYTLYLAARYRASTHYRPELQPTERAHRLTVMLANVATMIQRVIQERYMDASSLALWLANGSELLHMLKNDRHVGAFSTRAQDILADAVHTAFASLVRCVSLELAPAMSQFMADADEPAKEAGVLQIFSNTMALLRRCRVNAALTIQLFSHLFHAINATAFNALVSNGNLCVRWFGRRLKARLNALETWAERQGLELASQCHLATIMQATHLLQAPKYNAEELATLSSTCFKLNSLQVRALLQKYQPAADEPRLPAELIENVVRVAESVADTLARADGREIRLEEEHTLALALLLPEDGYSCEVIRGVPPGLGEFLAPLQRDGLCRMAPQPSSSGYWTIYMIDHHSLRSPSAMSNRSGGYSGYTGQAQGQPEIQIIKLHKSTNGMGLSIVAAKGAGQDRLGIYIKSVVAGGAADADGRLTAGDQLLKVDGQSLVGITQEKAAEYLVRTGPIVTLEVAKQGAIYHGLATLLSQPSPVMTRAHKNRPKSEHLEPSKLGEGEMTTQPSTSRSMGNLLSVSSKQIASTYQEHSVEWDVDRNLTLPGATVLAVPPETNCNQLNNSQSSIRLRQPLVCLDGRVPSHFPHYNATSHDVVQIPVPQRLPNVSNASWPHYTSHSFAVCEPNDSSVPKEMSICPSNKGYACPLELSSLQDRQFLNRPQDVPNRVHLMIPSQFEPRCSVTTCVPPKVSVQSGFNEPKNGPYLQKNKTEAVYNCEAVVHRKCSEFLTGAEQRLGIVDSLDSELTIPYIDQTEELAVDSMTHRSRKVTLNNDCQTGQEAYFTEKSFSKDQSELPKDYKVPRVSLQSYPSASYSIAASSKIIDTYPSLLNNIKNDQDEGGSNETVCKPSINIELVDDDEWQKNDDDLEFREYDSQIESDQDMEERIPTLKMHTVMPELNLDLSGLKEDVTSEETDTNVEKFWKSPEEIRLGCGRVAALAKHFSQLGDAGLIRLKSTKLSHSRQFVSEPDILSPRNFESRNYEKNCPKVFKSESDLSGVDKGVQVTPIEKRWSMILLNIQDKHNPCKFDENISTDTTNPTSNESTTKDSFKKLESAPEYHTDDDLQDKINEGALNINQTKMNDNKLSPEEQNEIIKQLEEFCNLDNNKAPLFIPEKVAKSEEQIDNAVENSSLKNCVRSVSKVGPNQKMDKLVKFYSVGDLSTSDVKFNMTSSMSYSDNLSKLNLILPTCTRIFSAPEISNNESAVFYIHISKSARPNKTTNAIVITQHKCGERSSPDLHPPEKCKSRSWEVVYNMGNSHESCENDTRKLVVGRRFSSPCAVHFRKCEKCAIKASIIDDRSRQVSSIDLHSASGTSDSIGKDNQLKKQLYATIQSANKVKGNLHHATHDKCYIHRTATDKLERSMSATDVTKFKPITKKPLILLKRCKSDFDVTERKSTPRFLEKQSWTYQEFPSLDKYDLNSRPRRMSERDLPSRLGHETTPQQIHISKSVPALHNMGAEGKPQHEIFNPGYSRASSSNSVTPPVQPPPMPAINGTTSLRSRSSHNLHDPTRMGTLPPTGLVSRQQSSPNLNPTQTHSTQQNSMQNSEAERFYQNLSIYRNQDSISIKQQPSPPQNMDDRSSLHTQKSLRGSQNSLNRPSAYDTNQNRDRPISAYIPQGQQQNFGSNQIQHQNQHPPRSQSSRDIIRQEAKLQEMQEEVRRRELRAGVSGTPSMMNQYRPAVHNARSTAAPIQPASNSTLRQQKPLGSTSNLGPTSPTGSYGARQPAPASSYTETQHGQYGQYAYGQYGQYGQYAQYGKHPIGAGQYGVPPKGRSDLIRHPAPLTAEPSKDYSPQETVGRPYVDQNRHFAGQQVTSQYSNELSDIRNRQYSNDNVTSRPQNGGDANIMSNNETHTHPILSEEGYRESPPPPPPNTSTHPLYNKPSDARYTASMQDPPRGGYYPTGAGTLQQPRQYQFSATNPWQREEREKEQARRREAARQWRDQQIAELSAMAHRTPQQEEQLRALQLERDFQKRAEEAANQQDDDDESNDADNESTQRVQGLLRMAQNQARNNQTTQQATLSRTNAGSQSMRTTLPSQTQPANVSMQQGNQDSENAYTMQTEETDLHTQQQHIQSPNLGSQGPTSPNYAASMNQFTTSQKTGQSNTSQTNEERERQRRIEDIKRKQAEFEENQRKRDEDMKQQQLQQQHIQQQLYQQQQHQHFRNQQQSLHPGMLRLDNLVINGPSANASQNDNNDAPPPPERGSSYAIMSQQSALRTNSSAASNIYSIGSQQSSTIKRVSFHDPNANTEPMQRNVSGNSNTPTSLLMDTIREDPNNFINDAETLLASPKTPEGSANTITGATPGVIGAQEVYKDPRQKRLAEKQKQQQNSQLGSVPEKLSFKEKMKMFAMETGEDGTPRDKVKISRAQREIDNIGNPISPNNNNRS